MKFASLGQFPLVNLVWNSSGNFSVSDIKKRISEPLRLENLSNSKQDLLYLELFAAFPDPLFYLCNSSLERAAVCKSKFTTTSRTSITRSAPIAMPCITWDARNQSFDILSFLPTVRTLSNNDTSRTLISSSFDHEHIHDKANRFSSVELVIAFVSCVSVRWIKWVRGGSLRYEHSSKMWVRSHLRCYNVTCMIISLFYLLNQRWIRN